MKLTLEQRKQIRDIVKIVDCPRDFICLKSDFKKVPKVEISGIAKLIECPSEDAKLCKFSFYSGQTYFCKCRLRHYAAMNLHI